MLRSTGLAILVLGCVAPRTMAGDATQRLDSPLSPGSGLTFSSSKSAQSLTFGISQEFSTGGYWQFGVSGHTADEQQEAVKVLKANSGLGPGAQLKLGMGWSSFKARNDLELTKDCRDFLANVPERFRFKEDGTKIGCADVYAAIEKDTSMPEPVRAGLLEAYTSVPPSFWTLSVNGVLDAASVDYRPLDGAGQPVLADARTKAAILPGCAIDLAFYRGALECGLQFVPIQASTDPTLVEVCETATQGNFSARDCGQAALGEPTVGKRASVAFAVAMVPLTHPFGKLVPGIEVHALAATRDRDNGAVQWFNQNTAEFSISAPVFLAKKDAPNGLRAGLAPEVTWPRSSMSGVFDVLLFVGASWGRD